MKDELIVIPSIIGVDLNHLLSGQRQGVYFHINS